MLSKFFGKPKPASSQVVDGPRFENADWKRGNLRKLYLLGSVLMIASATTGYDGYLHIIQPSQMQGLTVWPCQMPYADSCMAFRSSSTRGKSFSTILETMPIA